MSKFILDFDFGVARLDRAISVPSAAGLGGMINVSVEALELEKPDYMASWVEGMRR